MEELTPPLEKLRLERLELGLVAMAAVATEVMALSQMLTY